MCTVVDRRRSRRRPSPSNRSPGCAKLQAADAPRPVVTLDSGYDLETLAHATVDADLLVRLIKSRVVYRSPEQHPGRGRPRLHGGPFRLADERTHGQPLQSMTLSHAAYGEVRIDIWTELHVVGAPDAPFSVVRVQVERLPNKKLPPRPLWLAWIGGPLPADLSVLWRWYLRSRWSMPSASSNRHSGGPPSAPAPQSLLTGGPG